MTSNKRFITSVISKVSTLYTTAIALVLFAALFVTLTAETVLAASTYEYTTPGTFELTLPEGTKSMTVTSVGGGGGGAFYSNPGFLVSCGGGGGEIIKDKEVKISSVKKVTIVVAAGGKSTVDSECADGVAGGNSYITYNGTQYALAHGGGGAHTGSDGDIPGKAGGTGATDGVIATQATGPLYGLPGESYSESIGRGGYINDTFNEAGKPGAVFITCDIDIPTTGISISQSSLTLSVGGSSTLTATVSPSDATDKTVTWTTSNASVATVSGGKVTAIGAGTATITATSSGGQKATCTVTVRVPVTGITVSRSSLSLNVGATSTLTATVLPSDATNKSYSWSSNNTSVATVNSSGLVTAKANGTATITATTAEGAKTASCTVVVTTPTSGITVSPTTATIIKGKTQQLTATVAPSDASTKTVTWTSTNKSVATVSNAGIVAAVGGGITTITATSSDGSYTASCSVTVTVPVEGIKFNDVSSNVGMGSTTKLNYTITPSDATNKTVSWQSSDTAVATIDKSGTITPIASGGTEITVTTADGGYTDTTLLIVTNSLKTVKLKFTTESGKFPSFATAYYKSSGNVTEYPGIPVTSEGGINVTVPVTHTDYKLGISHINSLIAGMEIASTTTDATSSPLNMIEGDFNADNIINGTDWTIIVQRMHYGGGETQYGLTGNMNYDGKVDDIDLLLFNAPISFTGAPRFLTAGYDMAAAVKTADASTQAENSNTRQLAAATAFDLYTEETPSEASAEDDRVISETPPDQSIIQLTELKTAAGELRYEVTLNEPSGAINMFQLALEGPVSEITYALPAGFEIIGSGEKDGITVIAIGTQREGGQSIPANTPFITVKASAMPGVLYGEDYTTMQRASENGIETISLETGSNGASIPTGSSSGGGCNAGTAASALLAFMPFVINRSIKSYERRRNHK